MRFLLSVAPDPWVFLWPLLATGAAVAVLIAAVWWLRDWLRVDEPECSPQELLMDYRRLHQEGALSNEEYQSIRQKLAGQVQAVQQLPPVRPDSPESASPSG